MDNIAEVSIVENAQLVRQYGIFRKRSKRNKYDPIFGQ